MKLVDVDVVIAYLFALGRKVVRIPELKDICRDIWTVCDAVKEKRRLAGLSSELLVIEMDTNTLIYITGTDVSANPKNYDFGMEEWGVITWAAHLTEFPSLAKVLERYFWQIPEEYQMAIKWVIVEHAAKRKHDDVFKKPIQFVPTNKAGVLEWLEIREKRAAIALLVDKLAQRRAKAARIIAECEKMSGEFRAACVIPKEVLQQPFDL